MSSNMKSLKINLMRIYYLLLYWVVSYTYFLIFHYIIESCDIAYNILIIQNINIITEVNQFSYLFKIMDACTG